jgi:hypothetical protein
MDLPQFKMFVLLIMKDLPADPYYELCTLIDRRYTYIHTRRVLLDFADFDDN